MPDGGHFQPSGQIDIEIFPATRNDFNAHPQMGATVGCHQQCYGRIGGSRGKLKPKVPLQRLDQKRSKNVRGIVDVVNAPDLKRRWPREHEVVIIISPLVPTH